MSAPQCCGYRSMSASVRRAMLVVQQPHGIGEETSVAFSFTVTPHQADLNVWGLPARDRGARAFRIQSRHKTLSEDVWPDTAALYFAKLEAQAPLVTGDYTWRVDSPASSHSVPMPWSAGITYWRASSVLGEWPEYVCAEDPFSYFPGRKAAVPAADNPGF